MAPLSAPFLKGSTSAPTAAGASYLSSAVVFVGSAGSASSYSNFVSTNTILSNGSGPGVVTKSNSAGPVGSECDILASTALGSSATVTMAWRSRNNSENHSGLDSSEQLPSGEQY